MPLSISNSSAQHRSAINYKYAVLSAFLAFVFLITGYEGYLKTKGIDHYSISDDMPLWAMEREKIDRAKETSDMVLLLGGSRMQLGFSRHVFEEMYPDRPFARLDIAGAKPIASLIDIAENTDFNGTILMAVYTKAISLTAQEDQQPYVDYYHKHWNTNAKVNRWVKTILEEYLISMNPRYNIRGAFKDIVKRRNRIKRHYLTIDKDRGYFADYTKVEPKKLARNRKDKVEKTAQRDPDNHPERWLSGAAEVEPYVKQIVERGGRVVFIRFPVGMEDWQRSYNHRLPKEEFWDVQAEKTQATMIHFADYPTLQFDAPDASHIDQKDAPHFTRALLEILRAQGLLE